MKVCLDPFGYLRPCEECEGCYEVMECSEFEEEYIIKEEIEEAIKNLDKVDELRKKEKAIICRKLKEVLGV